MERTLVKLNLSLQCQEQVYVIIGIDTYLQVKVWQLLGQEIMIKRERLDERNKGVISKNCAPFSDCISETNNTQINNAKYIDVVMPMYNLIEYSDIYSETSIRWSKW